MTCHRQHVRRTSRLRLLISARSRAVASLLAVAALAAGLSVQGTFAFFTDSATLQTGPFTSGTLDLTLDGSVAGQGGSYTKADLNLPNMIPGESVAQLVAVKSAGTTTLSYLTSATSTAGLSGQLQVSIYAAGAASNTTPSATTLRTGTCSGAPLVTDKTVTSTNPATPTALTTTARSLATGAAENLCVRIAFNSAADSTFQGLTGQNVLILFDAKQVGA